MSSCKVRRAVIPRWSTILRSVLSGLAFLSAFQAEASFAVRSSRLVLSVTFVSESLVHLLMTKVTIAPDAGRAKTLTMSERFVGIFQDGSSIE